MGRDAKVPKGGYSAEQDQIPRIWEPGLTFMQDNAPIHKAKMITKWLRENGVKVLKWPPYSPDLNQIEHLWFVLKEIREALGKALKEAWESIPEKRFKVLWKKYNRRIDAVCKAKGWWTKY
jgi:transposase